MATNRQEYFKQYREKNREKFRAYNREYNKKWRKENGYHNEVNYNKRYPEKKRARKIFQWAVKSGKIKRGKCQICNKPNAQGHHEDYSKPLEVMWFCPFHHKQHHLKKVINTLVLA